MTSQRVGNIKRYNPRKDAKSAKKRVSCHFDRREKSFSNPSHSLGLTRPEPFTLPSWRLSAIKKIDRMNGEW
jgi:hypothetical protein